MSGIEKFKIGYIGTYVHDYSSNHIADLPPKVALEWVLATCPKADLSINSSHTPIDEMDFTKVDWESYWYNKLFIVIGTNSKGFLTLYNHDGQISLTLVEY